MNDRRWAQILLLGCGLHTVGVAFAHGIHGGSAQLETYNNDRTIAAQVYGGLHADAGAVKISFHGNIAFEIESPRGVKIFIDPWRNEVRVLCVEWVA